MTDFPKKFLHVGCGNKNKTRTTRGFAKSEWNEIRFDIDSRVNPDIVGDMLDMSIVGNGVMDALFSSHNIEHLYPHQVPQALAEFAKVLRPDGFLVITCPDLQAAAQLIAEDKLTEAAYVSPAGPIAPIDMLFGWRPALARGNHFMAHKCGFTERVLRDALLEAGFMRAASMRRGHPAYDLWCVATKAEVSDNDLRALAAEHLPLT